MRNLLDSVVTVLDASRVQVMCTFLLGALLTALVLPWTIFTPWAWLLVALMSFSTPAVVWLLALSRFGRVPAPAAA